jgi:hypothetical protein
MSALSSVVMTKALGEVPFGHVDLVAKDDIEEVLKRLASIVERDPDLSTRIGASLGDRTDKQFWGRCDAESFDLRPLSTRGLFFVPRIHGTIRRIGDESHIAVVFSTPRSLAFGFAAFAIWTGALAWVHEESIPRGFIIAFGLVLVAGFLFGLFPERRRAEQILRNVLCTTS